MRLHAIIAESSWLCLQGYEAAEDGDGLRFVVLQAPASYEHMLSVWS